ncbi:hypothetical protein ACWXVW_06585 [Pantoea dispersa]
MDETEFSAGIASLSPLCGGANIITWLFIGDRRTLREKTAKKRG